LCFYRPGICAGAATAGWQRVAFLLAVPLHQWDVDAQHNGASSVKQPQQLQLLITQPRLCTAAVAASSQDHCASTQKVEGVGLRTVTRVQYSKQQGITMLNTM
jgi:hypothetical protein